MGRNLRALKDLSKDSSSHSHSFTSRQRRRRSSDRNTKRKSVAILLATKQGERFLPLQLQSINNQIHTNWTLWVSDDGSTDNSLKLIERFQEEAGEKRVRVIVGPGQGHTANFLSLTCDSRIDADFYSYSDQDDIWEKDKLARAIDHLQFLPEKVPAMYCSRIRLIDEKEREIGLFKLWRKPPSFANALTQNIASGHTIVFNRAARNLLCEAGPYVDVTSHDWWCYLLLTGCGGSVIYDSYAGVRHRQHEDNCVGAGSSLVAKMKNAVMLLNNRFRLACDRNIKALKKIEHLLAQDNRETLHRFALMREASLIGRLIGLRRCRLYRQTFFDNIFLLMGAILKKI